MNLEDAIDNAAEESIKNGVLADFLQKHRAEVKDVILKEYNEELHIKSEKQLSFEEGKSSAILTLLGIQGTIPESLKKRIEEERNLETLDRWLIEAVNASSVDEFLKNIE